MRRLIAPAQYALVLTALLLVAVPVGLACCAGFLDVHGDDCCQAAMTEVVAGSCCEGGHLASAQHSQHHVLPPALQASDIRSTTGFDSRLTAVAVAVGTQRPPDGGLFALHSALLL